ncbi:hypothetical protein BCR33DRAFT_718166 [Rhizoclosmatium globosum]|uniref:Tyr recombinase domain-containing protein n=1 Tax=Rhizoclosmatium globosum TaxID=329046 RepID=A0A1Y2C6H1_9FUNG|nr:hypothetical protein BCR33DRAFT_718166 [Rhizoclosmatium globosum]|eukprot:ORY42477.1 hypothetical protein BCR33DRAFT_718166 [Rhizoclosmatium globosum]
MNEIRDILRRRKPNVEPADLLLPRILGSRIYFGEETKDCDRILQKLVSGAKLLDGKRGFYSSHCFRRGGAQYRFMEAPPSKRFSLAAVKWWGGWSPHESIEVILKYLLEELYGE